MSVISFPTKETFISSYIRSLHCPVPASFIQFARTAPAKISGFYCVYSEDEHTTKLSIHRENTHFIISVSDRVTILWTLDDLSITGISNYSTLNWPDALTQAVEHDNPIFLTAKECLIADNTLENTGLDSISNRYVKTESFRHYFEDNNEH